MITTLLEVGGVIIVGVTGLFFVLFYWMMAPMIDEMEAKHFQLASKKDA